jgi:hypothetical protein
VILYTAIKYRVLDFCIETVFDGIYKNLKPNLLLGNSSFPIVKGLKFDSMVTKFKNGNIEECYDVTIESSNRRELTVWHKVVKHNGKDIPDSVGTRIIFKSVISIDFFVNNQRFYIAL